MIGVHVGCWGGCVALTDRASLFQFLRRLFSSRQRDIVERRPGPLAPLAPLDFARNDDGSYVTPEQSDEGWAVQ